jgi:hypothetical protein
LQLENLPCKIALTIRQDYYAAMYMASLSSAVHYIKDYSDDADINRRWIPGQQAQIVEVQAEMLDKVHHLSL